jgi:hypothetical protein
MTVLVFDRATGRLSTISAAGALVAAAANFVDSKSEGPWPPGRYAFLAHNVHPDDAPDSAFGAQGILVFSVPGRTGMGVHSGRARIVDALGRVGICHCTLGCIRTTDGAMEQLLELHDREPITAIEVR